MDEWIGLRSVEEWGAKLQELLDEAEMARRDGDARRRRDAAARLRDFRRFSPPIAERLDELASEAIDGLVRQQLTESLTRLNEASSKLDGYMKRLREVAKEARSHGRWLSLRTPQAIAGRLDETAVALETLYETTKEFTNAEDVASRIDSALRAIRRLRQELRKAV